jgi:putative salt-induced outer membrane protein YdiY
MALLASLASAQQVGTAGYQGTPYPHTQPASYGKMTATLNQPTATVPPRSDGGTYQSYLQPYGVQPDLQTQSNPPLPYNTPLAAAPATDRYIAPYGQTMPVRTLPVNPPIDSPFDPPPLTAPLPPPFESGGPPPEEFLETVDGTLTEEFVATQWWQPVDWEGGLEIGLNGTRGNAETLSLRTGADLLRKTDLFEVGFDLVYTKATANGVETQHQALLRGTYEWLHPDSPWTYFARVGLVYDEFQAFDLRLALNTGLGYPIIDHDGESLKARFGTGTSREFDSPDKEWKPEAVFGIDYRGKLTERQEFYAAIDYFPNWSDFSDYRVVNDVGYEVLLDADHNLSLKLSVIDRYDSTPSGRKPNDLNYGMLLLWKL